MLLVFCHPSEAQIYACDAGPAGYVNLPAVQYANTPVTLTVIYHNYGTDTIHAGSLSVGCMVNNGVPSNTLITWVLLPGQTDSVFVSGVVFPAGFSTLCAFTTLACDMNPANDSLCHTQQALVYTSPPWFDDFETTNPCIIHPGGG
jgi:hypothetical protein